MDTSGALRWSQDSVAAATGPTLDWPVALSSCQVDAGDGAKGPEELLQVSLTSVLRQVGDTDGGIVISWAGKERRR